MELSVCKISAFNIPYMSTITYISFTFPLWRNTLLLRKNLLRGSIFHRTVLEGYWEFGARIGTKMKLAVSTFSSFRLFLFSKTTKLLNFWKCDTISFQNTTLTSRVFREFRMGVGPPPIIHIAIWDICHMYHRGSDHSVPNCDCTQFGGHRKSIWCVLLKKIIVSIWAGNETAYPG